MAEVNSMGAGDLLPALFRLEQRVAILAETVLTRDAAVAAMLLAYAPEASAETHSRHMEEVQIALAGRAREKHMSSPKTATVVQIMEYKDRDTVAALTDLLELARRGQIRGLLFAYKGWRRHHVGITGEYWDDPAQALGCTARMTFRLNEVLSSRDRGDG